MDLWSVIKYICYLRPNNIKTSPTLDGFAMSDAVSLSWPAVRAAWASSMHQVEKDHLSWSGSMQWAINRLSASQVVLAHTQTTTQPTPPMCIFCSHCMKQGKSLNHPENRCNAKQRQAGCQQQNSS